MNNDTITINSHLEQIKEEARQSGGRHGGQNMIHAEVVRRTLDREKYSGLDWPNHTRVAGELEFLLNRAITKLRVELGYLILGANSSHESYEQAIRTCQQLPEYMELADFIRDNCQHGQDIYQRIVYKRSQPLILQDGITINRLEWNLQNGSHCKISGLLPSGQALTLCIDDDNGTIKDVSDPRLSENVLRTIRANRAEIFSYFMIPCKLYDSKKDPYVLPDHYGDNYVTGAMRNDVLKRYEIHGTTCHGEPRCILIHDNGDVIDGINGGKNHGFTATQMFWEHVSILSKFNLYDCQHKIYDKAGCSINYVEHGIAQSCQIFRIIENHTAQRSEVYGKQNGKYKVLYVYQNGEARDAIQNTTELDSTCRAMLRYLKETKQSFNNSNNSNNSNNNNNNNNNAPGTLQTLAARFRTLFHKESGKDPVQVSKTFGPGQQ